MKKLIIGGIAGILPTILIIVIIFTLIMSVISTSNERLRKEKDDEEALEYSMLEEFKITGEYKRGTYILKFKFEGWSIDDINFPITGNKGTVTTTVKVPDITGDHPTMAYKYLRQQGFTPEGACGLMANIKHESGFNEVVIERTSRADKGYGICQWTFGRRTKIEKWLRNKGFDPYKKSDKLFLAQLQYAISEPGYEKIVSKMKKATDVAEATKIWCVEWERPANMYAQAISRAEAGRKYLEKYKNSSIYSGAGESKIETRLTLKYTVENGEVIFSGKLQGQEIAGSFKTSTVTGSGQYGEGAAAFGSSGPIGNPYGDKKFYITGLACAYEPGHTNPFHHGWDLDGGDDSTPIYAVMSGKVITAHHGFGNGYGNHVIIQSGNMYVLYAHMSSISVSEDSTVSKGTRIGNQGNTGNSAGSHLHLEFRKGKNSMSNSTANLAAMKPMLKRYADYSNWSGKFSKITR